MKWKLRKAERSNYCFWTYRGSSETFLYLVNSVATQMFSACTDLYTLL